MASIAELIENVAKIRRFVGIYLDVPVLNEKQRAALKVDLVQLDRNLAALREALGKVEPVVAPTAVRVVEEVPEYDHVLTEDEEWAIVIREQDKLLIEQGKPAGHGGEERGATTLAELIDICEKWNLPILLEHFRGLVVPGTAQ